jgi:hypothetical protein
MNIYDGLSPLSASYSEILEGEEFVKNICKGTYLLEYLNICKEVKLVCIPVL